MPTVLVSGANRGIGLEFVRQYAADGWTVHATSRDLARAGALSGIAGDVHVHQLDVTAKSSLDQLALTLKSVRLDLLIANAGVLGPRGMSPEMIDRESWIETFQVNCIGSLAFAGAFKANLLKGDQKKAVAISSLQSSITSATTGGFYVYRSSKAALNAAWHSLALEWAEADISCALLSPGWVRTDMGGAYAEVAPADSVAGMRRIIDGLTRSDSGCFFGHKGEQIPW